MEKLFPFRIWLSDAITVIDFCRQYSTGIFFPTHLLLFSTLLCFKNIYNSWLKTWFIFYNSTFFLSEYLSLIKHTGDSTTIIARLPLPLLLTISPSLNLFSFLSIRSLLYFFYFLSSCLYELENYIALYSPVKDFNIFLEVKTWFHDLLSLILVLFS